MKYKLPDKPSELIKLALNNLTLAEKSNEYEVDMANWHSPNGKCAVCFAGSVMAFSLKSSKKRLLDPDNFNKATKDKLQALEEFRQGNVTNGLGYMGKGLKLNRNVVTYKDTPQQFKKDMKKIIKDLEKQGL